MRPLRLALLLAVLALTVATAVSWTVAARPAHPHVILISVDGCRADHLGSYGYSRATSPNIDRVAREGAVFLHAYAQANESLMSHASLLSGRYAGEIAPMSYMSYAVPPSLATLPKLLKAAGYTTGGFTGGGHVSRAYGFAEGFDAYSDAVAFGTFYDSVPLALEWLASQRDRPTFTFLHGYDCHRPYRKPPVFGHLHDPTYKGDADGYLRDNAILDKIHDGVYYRDFELGRVWTSTGDRPIDPANYTELAKQKSHLDGRKLSDEDIRHLIAHYDGAVTYADTWMGVFFARLAELGFDASNTLVVIVADHGEDLMEHGVFNHRVGLQLSNIHVPMVFWGAGVEARGRTFDAVTENVDVMSTVLALTGVAAPPGLRGHNLAPLLAGGAADPEDRVAFSEGILGMAAVTSRRHQLIAQGAPSASQRMLDLVAGRREDGQLALYDLASDAGERSDVSRAPDEATAFERMRRILLQIEESEVQTRPTPQAPQLDPELERQIREHGYPTR